MASHTMVWYSVVTSYGATKHSTKHGAEKSVNTLRPRQNGRHFPDDSFKWIFLNENVWISIEVSLKFVPNGSINNVPALVQIMACRLTGANLNQWWLVHWRIYASLGLNELINVIRTYSTGYMSRIWTIYITYLHISTYISGRCVFPIRTTTMIVLVINGLLQKWHAMRAQGGKWHYVTFQSTITQCNIYIHNLPARYKLHIWTIRVNISAGPFMFRIIIMQNTASDTL